MGIKLKNDKYKMEVKNFALNQNISKRCNHPLLPQGIRRLIIGKFGCGKTTLLINLLLRPGWLDYNNINIFGNSLVQSEYRILKKAFEEKLPTEVIIELFENQNEITNWVCLSYQLLKKGPKRVETNQKLNAIFINRLNMFPTLEN